MIGKYKLVLIEWEDSQLGFQGWKFIDEQSHKTHVVNSVGYLVEDTDKYKVVFPHLSKDITSENASGSGDILIPTSAILNMTILTPSKKVKH